MNFQKFFNHPFINHQRHPQFPITIFNYSKETAYAARNGQDAWDEYTLAARGLILADDGQVVAWPFQKFFNLGEAGYNLDNLPNSQPVVWEKMDGSLGILYFWDGVPYIATRGSFVSEQALWGTNWLRERGYRAKDFAPGFTHLFEIIYPANQVVVNYGNRQELVLLDMVNEVQGHSVALSMLLAEANRLNLETPRYWIDRVPADVLVSCMTLDGNEEGFVLQWGDLRIKMKGAEYVMRHRSRFGLSNKWVWERLMNGDDLHPVEIEEEFIDYIDRTAAAFMFQFNSILNQAISIADIARKDFATRKEQALWLTTGFDGAMVGLVFGLLDGRDVSQTIWKSLKPKFEKYTPGL